MNENENENKNLIEKFRGCGYIAADDREEIIQALLMVSSRQKQKVQAMLMLGDAGVGKTFFAECFARVVGGEVMFYQCHYGTGKEELLYDLDIRGVVEKLSGGGGEEAEYLSPGILPKVLSMCAEGKKVVLILDELDKTKPALDAFLLDFIQSGRIYDPHLGHFEVNGGELYLIATSNQERLLSEPLMRRFRRVYMKYPPEEVEVGIIMRDVGGVKKSFVKGVVKIAGWLRRQEGVIKPPSTPELINLVQDVITLNDAKHRAIIAVGWLCAYEDDRVILYDKYPLSWWEGMLKDEDVLG